MILLSIARAADVTWISEPPSAPIRIEITAASWDPLSRGLIDVVLEQDLEVVVLMDQQPSAWAGLQALHPRLLVARTHLNDGVLGRVRLVQGKKTRWNQVLRQPGDPSLLTALDAFRAGDKKTLKHLSAAALPQEAISSGRFYTTVNQVAAQAEHLVAPPETTSFARMGLQPVQIADKTQPLILYGIPAETPLLKEVLAYHDIELSADGVRIGSTTIGAPDPVFIAALPSPWNPAVAVLVYASQTLDGPPMNAMFHGPTQASIGSRHDGKLDALLGFSLNVDQGKVIGPSIGKATLTAAEAVEDLQALHTLLTTSYSGLPALEWTLDVTDADSDTVLAAPGGPLAGSQTGRICKIYLRSGSSRANHLEPRTPRRYLRRRHLGEPWSARTKRFTTELSSQPNWSWEDYVELIVERYLDPVNDTHFWVQGVTRGARTTARMVKTARPMFIDARAKQGPNGFEVNGANVDLAIVPDPTQMKLGKPYAFPSVNAAGEQVFLVGVFTPDAPVELVLGERSFPLHRSRSQLHQRGSPWGYTTDGPLPVVHARTMGDGKMAGFQDGTIDAATHDELVLDLRGNYGGNDLHAHRWVLTLSPGTYTGAGGTDFRQGAWQSWDASTLQSAGEPWNGRLWVLIDGGVASAGETFAFLAAQVPGARLVGVPTSGCTENGNIVAHPPLPHSALEVSMGHTRFVWSDVRPVVEGIGIFPDIWLDTEDPVSFLAGLP